MNRILAVLIFLLLTGCPIQIVSTPKPTPTPTVPPPTPQPTPTPGSPFPAGLPPIQTVSAEANTYTVVVQEAAQSVLGCAAGTAGCNWTVPVVEAYDLVTAKLRAAGYDAGRYDDDHSGPWAGSDAIAVKARGTSEWHEWKLFNYGTLPNGQHSSEFRFTGAFKVVAATPPTEPPLPALIPCSPVTRIDLKVAWLSKRSVDATPKTEGLEACTALGFVNRRDCPLGIDGTEQRIKCESEAGPYTWSQDGVDCLAGWAPEARCWAVSGNPLLYAVPSPGRITVCAGNGFCSSMVLE